MLSRYLSGKYKLVCLPHAEKPLKLTIQRVFKQRDPILRKFIVETKYIQTQQQIEELWQKRVDWYEENGIDREWIELPQLGDALEHVREIKRKLFRIEHEERLPQSLSRTRRKVFEYAMCNDFSHFVTLTIDGSLHDRYDLSAYKKKLGVFTNHFRARKAPDFQYLLIPEFHQDGAVHMHGLIRGLPDGELTPNKYGYLDWPAYSKRFGFFSCSPIRNYEACARYVSKYITKDLQDFDRVARGKQLLLCSKGLKVPQVLDVGDGMSISDNLDFVNEYVAIHHFETVAEYAQYREEHLPHEPSLKI